MNRVTVFATFGVLAVLCAATGQPPQKSVDVVVVKYDGLKQEVLKHRGKVLIVDFWASG